MLQLDHLAIAAPTLEEARTHVETILGVPLQPGGKHPHFSTHNMLLGLADGLYLEAIAIDPEAPEPGYPRWFDLDRFTGAARVSNWICRTDDLDAMTRTMPETGRPVPLARGDLRWQMAVPEDGILPFDNCFPALIEWNCAQHPAQLLPASGCRLERLIVAHPAARDLKSRLTPVLKDPRVVFEDAPEAGLRAEIATPSGRKVLA